MPPPATPQGGAANLYDDHDCYSDPYKDGGIVNTEGEALTSLDSDRISSAKINDPRNVAQDPSLSVFTCLVRKE